MLAKILTSAVVLLSVAGVSVVLPGGALLNAQPFSGTVQSVQAAGDTVPVTAPQNGANAVRRVQGLSLRSDGSLDMGQFGDYPPNYTGLVGYAWQLPAKPELSDYDAWSRELRLHYAAEIPYAMLEPGDILANGRAGDFGEAIIFEKWEDPGLWGSVIDPTDRRSVDAELKQGVKFVGYEMERWSSSVRVVEKHLMLQEEQGAITIKDLEQKTAGPYFALRDQRLPGFVSMMGGMQALAQVKRGMPAYVQFSIVNRGGSPARVSDLTAVAFGPDAEQQGLASPQTNFKSIKEIVLQPGQVYRFGSTLRLSQPGTYFALPSFRVNGIMQVPMEPASFRILPE